MQLLANCKTKIILLLQKERFLFHFKIPHFLLYFFRSCVELGYWNDEFVQYFVGSQRRRRSPLINRGYWSRVSAVRTVVEQFLSHEPTDQKTKSSSSSASLSSSQINRQIITLGAGFDTLFFQLKVTIGLFNCCLIIHAFLFLTITMVFILLIHLV